MRRGGPRARGNNRAMQPAPFSRPSGGPQMTDHLQGLKDIDMELELLKRKREIIEQQQHMLSTDYRQRNEYEQSYSQPRAMKHERFDNYMYNEPRNSYGGGAPNRKRPIPVWENELPPKRFSAPSKNVKKAFGARVGPSPSNSRPAPPARFQSNAPRPAKPRPNPPPPKKREFNPTKVTKPSSAPQPLATLKAAPPAERKKMITEASSLASKTAVAVNEDDMVLRSDRVPSRQVTGRLELALGSIIKELKLANSEYEDLFNAMGPQRAMKQVVRERLRTIMTGKVIGNSENIKLMYYEEFPQGTDNDVILKGLEAHRGSDFIPIRSDDPEVYFKKNLTRLMTLKMDEMFNKIEKLYREQNMNPNQKSRKHRQRGPHAIKAEAVAKNDETEPKVDESGSKVDETPEAVAEQSKVDTSEPQTDNAQPNTDATPLNTDNVQPNMDVTQPNIEAAQPNTVAGEPNTDAAQPNTEGAQPNIDEVQPDAPSDKVKESPKDPREEYIISTEKYRALEKLMTYKLNHLLKKACPAILRILDIDNMYRKTKNSIIADTRKKFQGDQSVQGDANTSVAKNSTPPRHAFSPLPYYVKIMGRPGLPKRKAMQTFFDQFQPRSIKKHRTHHSLLFVGFNDKESFDKILAADGTVIGKFTLSIKVSERSNDPKINDASSANSTMVTADSGSGSLDKSIGPDIEEQISDLLTSIREAEQNEDFSEDVVLVESTENVGENTVKGECDAAKTEVIEVEDEPTAENGHTETKYKDETPNMETEGAPEATVKSNDVEIIEAAEENDKIEDLKNEVKEVKGTPTRASARLASTPGTIRTRRSSKLAQN